MAKTPTAAEHEGGTRNLLKFDVFNHWTRDIAFTAEIDCQPDASVSFKLGLAVRWAVKSSANLRSADLRSADLGGANLGGANLRSAENADLAIAQTRILPEGDLIGWKMCSSGVIVKLSIPAEAKRSHAFGRKCRAEFADVLEVIGASVGISIYDGKTEYRAGERVVPDRFDPEWMEECASGFTSSSPN